MMRLSLHNHAGKVAQKNRVRFSTAMQVRGSQYSELNRWKLNEHVLNRFQGEMMALGFLALVIWLMNQASFFDHLANISPHRTEDWYLADDTVSGSSSGGSSSGGSSSGGSSSGGGGAEEFGALDGPYHPG